MQHNPLDNLSLKNPIHFFALGLGSGLMKPAPGTWGSFIATIIGYFLLQIVNHSFFTIFTVLCFWIGCYLCQKTAEDMQVHDHGAIVWDEFVGIFITILAIPELSVKWCIVAFVIFRFFDILKPYPIRYFDQKLESGFGIMIDDVLAAIYSIGVIFIFRIIF
ncbi:phosphatidylglycerophosphatase [Bisgaardia hudsonensis]|uniref:Phosphatidylglycerophosphatase A n=1 Tax=Bisgaardia hudsonensis TaxID=109472 RepID=A0A4R2N3H4_9PAST|nr:phosphatidylglycerophosphatase A [Bisgaardia hudsonensis]QLB12814.1 phosphatidylglycerophosphatase [Bisgaardia hudsonensis]TCP14372.1 phosphatidylglycerophosphatase [Bisgaardia hudsonensis]